MSDEAQTTSSTPAAEPDTRLHTGGGYHAFQKRVQEGIARRAAQAKEAPKKQGVPGDSRPRVDQPPPVAKTVQPQPKRSLGEIQAQAAAEAEKINNPAGNLANDPRAQLEQEPPTGDETQQNQQTQQTQQGPTPEDLELLADLKAWIAGDKIPDKLLEMLKGVHIPLKNGEELEFETFDEVQGGRMRQKDHTREMQKIQRERAEWQQRERNYQSHFDAVFNDADEGRAGGEAMYEIFTRAGAFKQLEHLNAKWDADKQQDVDAANGLGLAILRKIYGRNADPNNPEQVRNHDVQTAIREEYKRRRASREREAHMRGIERENERLREANKVKQKDDDNAEYWAAQKRAHDQHRPRIMQQMGLDESDSVTMNEYNTQLFALINLRNAKAITPELVRDACRATKEFLKERGAKGKAGQNGQNGQERRPGFNPTLSGGGKVPSKEGGKQRWHSQSFAQRFGMPRWNG